RTKRSLSSAAGLWIVRSRATIRWGAQEGSGRARQTPSQAAVGGRASGRARRRFSKRGGSFRSRAARASERARRARHSARTASRHFPRAADRRAEMDGQDLGGPRVATEPARFFLNWLQNPLTVGALAPSGRELARLMTAG